METSSAEVEVLEAMRLLYALPCLFLTACSAPHSSGTGGQTTVTRPLVCNIERSSFCYEMSPQDFAAFKKRVEVINIGDSHTRVLSLMGPPHYDEVSGPKHSRDRGTLRRSMRYYIRRQRRDVANINDSYVQFVFDSEGGNLLEINSTSVQIPSRRLSGASEAK